MLKGRGRGGWSVCPKLHSSHSCTVFNTCGMAELMNHIKKQKEKEKAEAAAAAAEEENGADAGDEAEGTGNEEITPPDDN